MTVFVAPQTLQVGLIDTSVLVQDRETGRVILDPTVNLELQPSANTNPRVSVRAIHSHAKNKLLQAAAIDVPSPGWWVVKVFVRRDQDEVVLVMKLLIMPPATRLAIIWPLLTLPPFVIGLFALHQTLRHSRLLRINVRRPSATPENVNKTTPAFPPKNRSESVLWRRYFSH